MNIKKDWPRCDDGSVDEFALTGSQYDALLEERENQEKPQVPMVSTTSSTIPNIATQVQTTLQEIADIYQERMRKI